MFNFIKQLVTTPAGKVSHSKFWSNVSMALMTVVIGYMAFKGTLTLDFATLYLGVGVGGANASKLIAVFGERKKDNVE